MFKADLLKLMEWIRSNPEVPDGVWCKDFGGFKLVGHGATPGTFLEENQPCHILNSFVTMGCAMLESPETLHWQ
ncbi:MAG: hypothetical protein ACLQU1_29690 [Bryobacteraceae bacterium]